MMRDSLRVVMLVDSFFPRSQGGVEVYSRDLAADLRRAGHGVHFATPSSEPRADETLPGGLPLHYYPFPAAPTRAEHRLDVPPRGFEEFAAWLDELAPDVVHAHYPAGPTTVPQLEYARSRGAASVLTLHFGAATCIRNTGRRSGTPMLRWGRVQCDGTLLPVRCSACLLQAHGVPRALAVSVAAGQEGALRVLPDLDDRLGARAALPAVVRRKRSVLERLYAALDALVVSAEWQRGALLANGLDPERITVVRHGTAVAGRVARRQQGPHVVFGWAGRPVPEKGLVDLLEAFRGLKAADATLRIACAASSREDDEFRAALRVRYDGDPRIVWVPPFTSEEMSRFYGAIDVFVAPYAMETGPLTVVEAFAHGVPVIGSAVGGIRELVRDGVDGRLFTYGSVDALRTALAEAIPAERRLSWAERVRWTRSFGDVAADYLSVYRGASARHEPSGAVAAPAGTVAP